MRISDWSSDVCSSDLLLRGGAFPLRAQPRRGVQPLRRLLLLVPEDVGQDVQRVPRPAPFLDLLRRRERDVLPDALPGLAGYATALSRLSERVRADRKSTRLNSSH